MNTVIEKQFEPKTEVQPISIKTHTIHIEQSYFGTFFVVARTTTGGRYYSQTYEDYNYVYNIFLLYKDVVRYFGGGNIELYSITPDGYNVLESVRI